MIPTMPKDVVQTLKPGDVVPYVSVNFVLEASVYMSPLFKTRADGDKPQVRRMVADCVRDAAGDGNQIALLLTPDGDRNDATGVPNILRAAAWDKTTKAMRLSECPVHVYGDVREDDQRITGFLTTPASAPALAQWIRDLGGTAETTKKHVN